MEYGFATGIVVLLAALVVGMTQYRRRDPRNEAVTEAATHALRESPETYDAEVFRSQLRKEEDRT